MTGIALPGGGTLYGDSTIVPVPYEPPPYYESWVDAGGTSPAFGAVDQGGGAVPIDLGDDPVIQSSFSGAPGQYCTGHCRIKTGTTGETGGTGLWTVTGLPVPPAYQTDGGFNGGVSVGYGFILDFAAGVQKIPVLAVLDPVFHATQPVLFPDYTIDTGDVLPVAFSTPTEYALCSGSEPFDFIDGAVLNITWAYWGDT